MSNADIDRIAEIVARLDIPGFPGATVGHVVEGYQIEYGPVSAADPRPTCVAIVRAVLTAIREPSEDV